MENVLIALLFIITSSLWFLVASYVSRRLPAEYKWTDRQIKVLLFLSGPVGWFILFIVCGIEIFGRSDF